MELTEVIIVALMATASTISGVIIAGYYDSKRRGSEEKRWYADYFLGKKIDALNNLYASLVDCHSTLNLFGNNPPLTLNEFKENVETTVKAYKRAKAMASVYLDEDGDKILSKSLGAFQQAYLAIWLSLPDKELSVSKSSYSSETRNLDWENFYNAYKDSEKYLREKLNPKVLNSIERK